MQIVQSLVRLKVCVDDYLNYLVRMLEDALRGDNPHPACHSIQSDHPGKIYLLAHQSFSIQLCRLLDELPIELLAAVLVS